MTTRLIFKVLSMVALGLMISLSGCARYYAATPVTTTYAMGCNTCNHAAPVHRNVVRIESHMYNPQVIEIMKGQRVVWVNYDNVDHTVTSNNGSFNSGKMVPGEKYVKAFNHRGTYHYYCKFHPEMKGVVVVR